MVALAPGALGGETQKSASGVSRRGSQQQMLWASGGCTPGPPIQTLFTSTRNIKPTSTVCTLGVVKHSSLLVIPRPRPCCGPRAVLCLHLQLRGCRVRFRCRLIRWPHITRGQACTSPVAPTSFRGYCFSITCVGKKPNTTTTLKVHPRKRRLG